MNRKPRTVAKCTGLKWTWLFIYHRFRDNDVSSCSVIGWIRHSLDTTQMVGQQTHGWGKLRWLGKRQMVGHSTDGWATNW